MDLSGEDPPSKRSDMEILDLSSSDEEKEHATTTPQPDLTLGSVFDVFPSLKSGVYGVKDELKIHIGILCETQTQPKFTLSYKTKIMVSLLFL